MDWALKAAQRAQSRAGPCRRCVFAKAAAFGRAATTGETEHDERSGRKNACGTRVAEVAAVGYAERGGMMGLDAGAEDAGAGAVESAEGAMVHLLSGENR